MQLPGHIRELHRNEEGSLLTFWAVSLAVLLGFVALSFDLGRASITQTELQSYADSVALAAAGELDGRTDSIARAEAAAAALIVDSQSFGSGAQALWGADGLEYQIHFYAALPAIDTSAMPLPAPAVAAQDARFVLVIANSQAVEMTFGAAFRSLSGRTDTRIDVGAYAVAGHTQVACDISTMMMCVPDDWDPNAAIGSVVELRSGGGVAGQWGPGNYGFLTPPGLTTAADPLGACGGFNESAQEWCVLAAQRPVTTCFDQSGVDTRPGQSVGRMAAAINTRFDIYEGVLNSYRNHPSFGPAPNIISGREITRRGNGQCNVDQADAGDATYTVGLPPDDCFGTSAGCDGGRFGDGEFAAGYADYLATNYDSVPAWFPAYPTTRYQIYLDEIANSVNGAVLTGRQETGGAVCNAANRDTDPARRVIIIAGIDCGEHDVRGRSYDIPVDTWVRGFILQPATSSEKDIFVEILGGASGGDGGDGSGTIRDVVRLYR